MHRLFVLALVPLVAACTVYERPAAGAPAPQSAPPPGPPTGVGSTGRLPAGLYDVRERVVYDTCRPTRSIAPRVTLLKRHENGVARASVPLQRFGDFDKPKRRIDLNLLGYQGSGMSHPKRCPGLQNTYRESLENVTDTSFQVHAEFEVADGWDCPNPRPAPLCKTSVIYEYRLASAACEAHCDGFVPNVRDEDVPDGPIAISCDCP